MADAASENKKFADTLRAEHGFKKLVYTTCLAHGLHNVVKELKKDFSGAHDLIQQIKTFFSKAPNRRRRWEEINAKTKVRLPVRYCETRWCSWLEAIKYVSENLDALRCQDMTLEKSIFLIESLRQSLEENETMYGEQAVSQNVKAKFEYVFTKNIGFVNIQTLVDVGKSKWNAEKMGMEGFQHMTDAKIELVLGGPATSSDVERSFSVYKAMLRPNRNRFDPRNFTYHLVTKIHLNKLKVG